MTFAPQFDPTIRGVVFDLDRTLIDARRAWCYALQEALLVTRGERIETELLAEEYQYRPWRDAISIVEPEPRNRERCEQLCEAMYARSALKRLLVFEGIGMMLDELRGGRVEVGAISRLPHHLARKQIESTGLERFVAVLESSDEPGEWAPEALLQRCGDFLETDALLFVGVPGDAEAIARVGYRTRTAGWRHLAPGDPGEGEALSTPRELLELLRQPPRGR